MKAESGIQEPINPAMTEDKKIKTALVAVFNKKGIEPIVRKLHELGVQIYSTGGTYNYIKELAVPVGSVEGLTSFPSVFGGRVKTLHPKVFGGILSRRHEPEDTNQLMEFHIPEIDLVIVDLYPFEETLAAGGTEQEIIEKIDVGGVSLIRAGAKNFRDVLTIPSRDEYAGFQQLLEEKEGTTSLADRKHFARKAFSISAHYDAAISNYFANEEEQYFQQSIRTSKPLRYGENPHQKGIFYGDFESILEQKSGKELSYNNLLDVDAAVKLIEDFQDEGPTMAVIKHNNACGLATADTLQGAWDKALAGDPVSAFGGILISNKKLDKATAEKIHELFFEVLIAPDFDKDALEILTQKKKRVILQQKERLNTTKEYRTVLNGVLYQDRDQLTEKAGDLESVTKKSVSSEEMKDLIFANKIVKHTKSNAIVLAKDQQLCASGTGQTSRVDALKQAIHKAGNFGFDLNGAVMASDAFFPFMDCVEIADNAGIKSVVQPGGSIRDQESIDYCDEHDMSMVVTGHRHFKH